MRDTRGTVFRSTKEKIVIVLAGMGFYTVAASVLEAIWLLSRPYLILHLGISSTDVRPHLLRGLRLYLAFLPAGMLIGWLMRKRGWLYGLVAVVCMLMPDVTLSSISMIPLLLELLRNPENIFDASVTPSAGLVALLSVAALILSIIVPTGLGALGGFCGQWYYHQRRARLRQPRSPTNGTLDTSHSAPISMKDKAVVMLAGMGLYAVALKAPNVLGLVPSLASGLHVFRQFSPYLALLVASMLIGWLMQRGGWWYGIVGGLCTELPGSALSSISLIQASLGLLPDPAIYVEPGIASPGLANTWFGTILVPLVLAVALGAIGGFCGQWSYQRAHGDYGYKIAELTRAIALNPNDSEARYDRGWAYRNLGDHERAIADFSQAIGIDSAFAEAYYGRGVVYGDLGEHERAVEDFTDAIRLDPSDAAAYCERGLAHDDLGEYEQAIEDFTEAIRLDPNDAAAYYDRGLAHRKLGEYQHAIADFAQAIRIDPYDAEAHRSRGLVHYLLGEYEHAIADLTEAIRLDLDFAEAYYDRAVVHDELAQYEQAIGNFSEAIRVDHHFAEAYYNRGLAYRSLAEHERAIADLESYLRLAPGDDEPSRTRARRYIDEIQRRR